MDENGDPLPSPEEVKMIINSINAFKYEEKKGPSGKKVADSEKEQCAICLEHIPDASGDFAGINKDFHII